MATDVPVLVVEDEQYVARAVGRVLQPYFSVLFASTLAQSKKLLQQTERLRGAVVDVVLPDGSGMDLVLALRLRDAGLPILVVTGYHETDLANQASRLSAEYVCKPTPPDCLRAFGRRMIVASLLSDHHAAPHVEDFGRRFGLSLRETEIVARAMVDEARQTIATAMEISENTLKAEIMSILRKSGEPSLGEIAWNLRAAATTHT